MHLNNLAINVSSDIRTVRDANIPICSVADKTITVNSIKLDVILDVYISANAHKDLFVPSFLVLIEPQLIKSHCFSLFCTIR